MEAATFLLPLTTRRGTGRPMFSVASRCMYAAMLTRSSFRIQGQGPGLMLLMQFPDVKAKAKDTVPQGLFKDICQLQCLIIHYTNLHRPKIIKKVHVTLSVVFSENGILYESLLLSEEWLFIWCRPKQRTIHCTVHSAGHKSHLTVNGHRKRIFACDDFNF